MAMRYEDFSGDEKAFRSHTGLGFGEFEALMAEFRQAWREYLDKFTLEGKERRRRSKGRENAVFSGAENLLLFVLYYLKTNPLQEVLASAFGMDQPQANRWLQLSRRQLYQALDRLGALPARSSPGLNRLLKGRDTLLLDVTERPVQRSGDNETQKEHYSGKKNAMR